VIRPLRELGRGACAYSLWLERRCRSMTPPHSLCPLPRSRSGALNWGELGPGSVGDWMIGAEECFAYWKGIVLGWERQRQEDRCDGGVSR
jgi:hypothetical protein